MVTLINIANAPDAFKQLRIPHATAKRVRRIGWKRDQTALAHDIGRLPNQAHLRVFGMQIEKLRHMILLVKAAPRPDRKSTRLNSSHVRISYAVFCLKKKNHNSMGRASVLY